MKQRLAGISSGRQLAFKVNQLRSSQNLKAMIDHEVYENDYYSNVDDAVESVLEFLRQWAMHYFPRYLSTLERIQVDIYNILSRSFGDYSRFIGEMENLFLPAVVVALGEYGLSVQVGNKLSELADNITLDQALAMIQSNEIELGQISDFERGFLDHVKRSLGGHGSV